MTEKSATYLCRDSKENVIFRCNKYLAKYFIYAYLIPSAVTTDYILGGSQVTKEAWKLKPLFDVISLPTEKGAKLLKYLKYHKKFF